MNWGRYWHYLKRFTLVHVLTYLLCGLFFMIVMEYAEEFAANKAFAHFRPLNSPIVQAAVLFQFIRGALLAVVLYPFRKVIIEGKFGWIYLWGVLLVLTSIGAVNTAPGSIEGFIYTDLNVSAHLVGYPEVITQTLLFSLFFWWWERKRTQ